MLTPSEVRNKPLPPEVEAVFDALIKANWNGYKATFTLAEAAAAIASRLNITTDEVYKRHYLDVEDAYRRAGWHVVFDKPGYNETYNAFFVFSEAE